MKLNNYLIYLIYFYLVKTFNVLRKGQQKSEYSQKKSRVVFLTIYNVNAKKFTEKKTNKKQRIFIYNL